MSDTLRWVGQAGFSLRLAGLNILIDPYLSYSIEHTIQPDFVRLLPPEPQSLAERPDVLVCTHPHQDHTDLETLKTVLDRPARTHILAPPAALALIRTLGFSQHLPVALEPGVEYTVGPVTFRAVRACHGEPGSAVGVVLAWGGRKLYCTGDTLYHPQILEQVGPGVDLLLVCMNGVGGNMNIADAARFAKALRPRTVLPMHWGMFEKATADPDAFLRLFEGSAIRAVRPVYEQPCELSELL